MTTLLSSFSTIIMEKFIKGDYVEVSFMLYDGDGFIYKMNATSTEDKVIEVFTITNHTFISKLPIRIIKQFAVCNKSLNKDLKSFSVTELSCAFFSGVYDMLKDGGSSVNNPLTTIVVKKKDLNNEYYSLFRRKMNGRGHALHVMKRQDDETTFQSPQHKG